jgi:hypothetical protein
MLENVVAVETREEKSLKIRACVPFSLILIPNRVMADSSSMLCFQGMGAYHTSASFFPLFTEKKILMQLIIIRDVLCTQSFRLWTLVEASLFNRYTYPHK